MAETPRSGFAEALNRQQAARQCARSRKRVGQLGKYSSEANIFSFSVRCGEEFGKGGGGRVD